MGKSTLVDMLAEDLESKFLKRFESRIPTAWNEAIGRSIEDASTNDALKRYAFGHSRYFLIQSLLLDVGTECGYDSRIEYCQQNNYPIPVVSMGRFIFTTHFAFNPTDKYVPNSSITRQQNSSINNEYLNRDQLRLFGPSFDDSKISSATEIRGNILFGCGGNGLDFLNHGFLRIAIPSTEAANGKDSKKVFLVENHNYRDILALVSEKERASKPIAQPVIDVALPKIKSNINRS